jgi:hypothetical protein
VDLWELSAREQIRELLATHTYLQDSPRYADVLDLYDDDALLDVAGQPVRRVRDVLRAASADAATRRAGGHRRTSWHHLSNVRIRLISRVAAESTASFVNIGDVGIDHWGRYRDELVGDGDRWRITTRHVRIDGRVDGSWAPAPA